MTKDVAFVLAAGATCAALAYGGIWMYGDGFIFNRFTGSVVYVDLPEEEEMLDAHAAAGADPRHEAGPAPAGAVVGPTQVEVGAAKRTSITSWSWPSSRVFSISIETGVPNRRPRPFTIPIATGRSPGRFDR